MKNGNLLSRKKYYGGYTLLFIVVAACIFYPFYSSGKSFIFSGKGADGLVQHFNAFIYLGRWGRQIIKNLLSGNPVIPQWNFQIGYGSDIFSTLAYYGLGDPLNLLSLVIPEKYAAYAYSFLYLFRIYLSGLSFLAYTGYINGRKKENIFGAPLYVFCGFTLIGAMKHPFFVNPMIYLPLMLLGLERIFRENKPGCFVIAVFLSAISNFYFFYMTVIITVAYALVRYIALFRKKGICFFGKTVGRVFFCAVAGTLMAGVTLIPVVIAMMNQSRLSEKTEIPLFYPKKYYVDWIVHFADISAKDSKSWTYWGIAPVCLIAVLVLFLEGKKYWDLKAGILFVLAGLSIPYIGHVMNGFSYVTNRFCFVTSFAFALAFVFTYPLIYTLSVKKKVVLLGLLLFYSAYCYWWVSRHGGDKSVRRCLFQIVVYSLLYVVVFVGRYLGEKRTYAVLFLFTMSVIAVNANYGLGEKSILKIYEPFKTAYKALTQNEESAVAEVVEENGEKDFYRYESLDDELRKSSILSGQNSTSFFWSVGNSNVTDFLSEMGVCYKFYHKYLSADARGYLGTLSGVKYYVSRRKDGIVSGNKLVGKKKISGKNYYVYENENALPLGYTYSSYIKDEDYQKMTAVQKQQAVLQGCVLKKQPETEVSETNVSLKEGYPEFEIVSAKDIEFKGNMFYVKKRNASVTIRLKQKVKGEVYVYFKDLKYLSRVSAGKMGLDFSRDRDKIKQTEDKNQFSRRKKKHKIKVQAGKREKTFAFVDSGWKYYRKQGEYLINLGYQKQSVSEITISFDTMGFYSGEDFGIIAEPVDSLESQVSAMKEESLSDVDISDNEITGKISVSQDKLLCLSVPYSKGWTAYVDGKKTEIYQANTMYMALSLTEGSHEIRLVYVTPGLAAGGALSLLGIAFFIGIEIREKWKEKNMKGKHNRKNLFISGR